ncbi:MAG: hypothetical protein QM647_02070 [Asticcacaulis sp.]|uniref:hypothetical protein n=1 Tax=Asticcacaulis sp. TaxID=1872648 RepID=UPI0039E68378
MTVTTSKGLARDSVLKPGETILSDASGVPFTPENRDRHASEYAPTGIDDTPRLYSGAALDIDSRQMPDDGVVEVHDTDEDLLAIERESPISDKPEPVR